MEGRSAKVDEFLDKLKLPCHEYAAWGKQQIEMIRAKSHVTRKVPLPVINSDPGPSHIRIEPPYVGEYLESRWEFTKSIEEDKNVGKRVKLCIVIDFVLSCFDALAAKNNNVCHEVLPLIEIFKESGARVLTAAKYESKYRSDIIADARNKIVYKLVNPFFREELVEYLLHKRYYPKNEIHEFLVLAILKEKSTSKTRGNVHTSTPTSWDLFERRCQDHDDLNSDDFATIDLKMRKGLSTNVITKFCEYLNILGRDKKIQVFHAHSIHLGDNPTQGHFTQSWIYTAYLKEINRDYEEFIFVSIDVEYNGNGGHLVAYVGNSKTKRIFSIDIENKDHSAEIMLIGEALDHYKSNVNRRDPWKKEKIKIEFQSVSGPQQIISADYILYLLHEYITTGGTIPLTTITTMDFVMFRRKIQNVLLVQKK